jgi:hypothetical protein
MLLAIFIINSYVHCRGVGTGRYPSSLPKEKGLKIGSGSPSGGDENGTVNGVVPPPPQPSSPTKELNGELDLGITGQRIVPKP